MIYDRIENLNNYEALLPNLRVLDDYLKTHDVSELSVGEYKIDDNVILKVKKYMPREKDAARWEAHEVYADVQYVISGNELMGLISRDEITPLDEYNPVSDSVHYKWEQKGQFFPLKEGTFMLLMPDDIHMPSLANENPKEVFKIIAKVRI